MIQFVSFLKSSRPSNPAVSGSLKISMRNFVPQRERGEFMSNRHLKETFSDLVQRRIFDSLNDLTIIQQI